jgi:hypothetical protein
MKNIAKIIIIIGLGSNAFAQKAFESEPKLGLATATLSPAKLHPATGLDAARGLGQRGTERITADTADAWKVRFPKQPNGRPR